MDFRQPVRDFAEGVQIEDQALMESLHSAYIEFRHKLQEEAFAESDGFFDPLRCPRPLFNSELFIRGKIAMIEFECDTEEAHRVCRTCQNNVRPCIDLYANSVGYRLPLRWDA